ncbi:MAG: PspC domain-containing protein [Oscillospiraceae bacterium]|jgi:phage shock protein PspC (stress-responsive transcriptional regulator)|nr:PspC domain-containing protein [Oscillospiraceae bacterium]
MSFNGKKLTRKRGGKLCGVCLGVADYLEVDVTVIRLVWAISAFFVVGFFAYIAAAFILPLDD